MLFLVLSVTDFRLCVQLLSGDTNKMLSSANYKAVICFSLRWRIYLDKYCKISAVVFSSSLF